MQNWSGNYTYRAARIHRPRSVAELCEVVRRADKLKSVGTRHSFHDIADCADGDLVSLEHFTRIDEPDAARRMVTLDAGVRYGELCRFLHKRGWALHNLASLPHISVAGAVATGTHGSGDHNGNLATAVRAMEVMTADGKIREWSRESLGDNFDGVVVSLGALGVVTRVTLAIEPAYDVRQDVYENLPLETAAAHFDQITSSGDSVSLFTDWRGARFTQVWLKRRVRPDAVNDAPPTFFGATRQRDHLHPIAGISAENCTRQMGIAGPWHERLPHFRMEFTPSSGEELQSEYFVPRAQAVESLRAIDRMSDRIAPLVQVSEVRTITVDSLWLSPCFGRDSVAIHFTWVKDQPVVEALLPHIEAALAPFDARPHWGKLFAMGAQRIGSLYAKLPSFLSLMHRYDPRGKFHNAYIARVLTPSAR